MGKGMRAGKRPKKQGGGNIQQQMQAMQKQMDEVQAQIDQMEATATSGGGAVTVTVSGKKELTDIRI
ncbi:MAG: YbaB/EbfC family nucleoid-associated protein, partial [Bacillota bacterium]|nr:YbaB/EbfC family nucleoid-associated protein [Bacillota bacterium]